MSGLPRNFFVCKECGGRGMLFPKQPNDSMGSTMVRCKNCGADVMTIGEMMERMKPFLPAKCEKNSN